MRAVRQRDPRRHAGAMRRELLDERQKRQVEEDQPVFRVVDDVRELVEEEPRVDRVDDRFHPRHGVVELEVAVPVPGERADALAGHDAEAAEGAREPARPGVGVAVRVAVNGSFDRARHDFGVAVAAVRVADERRDQQRAVHHQTEHGRGLANDGNDAVQYAEIRSRARRLCCGNRAISICASAGASGGIGHADRRSPPRATTRGQEHMRGGAMVRRARSMVWFAVVGTLAAHRRWRT